MTEDEGSNVSPHSPRYARWGTILGLILTVSILEMRCLYLDSLMLTEVATFDRWSEYAKDLKPGDEGYISLPQGEQAEVAGRTIYFRSRSHHTFSLGILSNGMRAMKIEGVPGYYYSNLGTCGTDQMIPLFGQKSFADSLQKAGFRYVAK